jgi:hypothetical protein
VNLMVRAMGCEAVEVAEMGGVDVALLEFHRPTGVWEGLAWEHHELLH